MRKRLGVAYSENMVARTYVFDGELELRELPFLNTKRFNKLERQ